MKQSPLYYPTTVGTKWVYKEEGSEETLVVAAVEDIDGAKVVTVEKIRRN